MRILMCRPDFFAVQYQINPWMDVTQAVDLAKAHEQWEKLYQLLINHGAQIDLIPPVAGLPDMVFTANYGSLYHGQFILSQFRHPERQAEVTYFKQWCIHAGLAIAESTSPQAHFFEGGGDLLAAGEQLFAGYGFRSEKSFYEDTDFFHQAKLIYCELVDPCFYHLDTCFCPLNENLALWYPGAFSEETQKKMASSIELIEVTAKEAHHFACNAVVVENHVILPADCPNTSLQLEQAGFTTHACEMSEFLKAGGACKCLTLLLD